MVQNYTPVMWDDKAFAFVPYEAFSDLPHYPKEKCEQICKELNSLIRLCTYRPKKEDIYFHPVSYVRRSGGFIVTDNQASFEKCPYPACADRTAISLLTPAPFDRIKSAGNAHWHRAYPTWE